MADEASESLAGGLKNYLGALGFIAPLLGGEELIRFLVTGGGGHTLPWWASIILIAAGLPIYLSPAAWKSLRTKLGGKSDILKLQYLSNKDAELGGAIRDMVWYSAWGKWYAAQVLATNNPNPADEGHVFQIAAHLVQEELRDGRLEARGRNPGQMEYEAIPRTHWRSTALHFIKDKITLWKMILIPVGGAMINPDGTVIAHDDAAKQRTDQLAAYDSIIIDSHSFESLWPRKDKPADKARKQFLKKAKKAGANADEIAKLSRD
jgi:hypothetical protein